MIWINAVMIYLAVCVEVSIRLGRIFGAVQSVSLDDDL